MFESLRFYVHWNIIDSFTRCFDHQISTDFKHVLHINKDLDFNIHADLNVICCIVEKSIQSTITILITSSTQTDIDFYCQNDIDLTVRLIILFPEQAIININIFLCGKNSRVKILGMYALCEQQNIIIKSQQIHCAKKCISTIVMQGLLTDKAQSYYEGTIRIEQNASGTYALQNNKNILLSEKSCAISIPNIEVLNHDVQCYHGAAVGKFDFLQMQYMQSRGLEQHIIQQLLIQALFEKPLQGYEKRDEILKKIYEKI